MEKPMLLGLPTITRPRNFLRDQWRTDQPVGVAMKREQPLEIPDLKPGNFKILGFEYNKQKLSDFEELGELGRGAFGVVRKARHRATNVVMAVKIIRITGNAEADKRTMMDLNVIMKSNDCPHIVRYYGCFVFESEVRIYMELMTMCLEKLLKKTPRFPEVIVGKITHSVLLALKYLKDNEQIMHRDIKPSNILINYGGTIKMCDFGVSGRLIDSSIAESNAKGSVAYLSPERVGPAQSGYGVRADIWSLGITLIEIASGRHPYDDCLHGFEVLAKIANDPPPQVKPSSGLSSHFCSFVSDCLQKDPHQRPSYKELLEYPFIKISVSDTNSDVAAWFESVIS